MRVRRNDGKVTRDRILEVAGRLIAAHGFAHTTARRIAAEAGVDVAAINYYFGSRDGLYDAVLAEGHRYFLDLEALARLAESPLDPQAKLAELFRQFVARATARRSWQAGMFARELLSPSARLATFVQREGMPKILYIRKIMSQVTGIPAGDPATLRCTLSVMAPCLMMIVAGSGVPGPLQQVRKMDEKVLVDHMTRFALAGLNAISRTGRKTRRRR